MSRRIQTHLPSCSHALLIGGHFTWFLSLLRTKIDEREIIQEGSIYFWHCQRLGDQETPWIFISDTTVNLLNKMSLPIPGQKLSITFSAPLHRCVACQVQHRDWQTKSSLAFMAVTVNNHKSSKICKKCGCYICSFDSIPFLEASQLCCLWTIAAASSGRSVL